MGEKPISRSAGKRPAGKSRKLAIFALIILVIVWGRCCVRKPVTIKAGSYTGQVVDEDTGQPIEGAAVYMGWKTDRDHGPIEGILVVLGGRIDAYGEREYLGEVLAFTDAEGRYELPEETYRHWLNWRFEKPTIDMLIYKKGYVGYVNKFGFGGREWYTINRPDHYKQKDNKVRLVPWREGYSHWEHWGVISSIADRARNKDITNLIRSLLNWEADRKYREPPS